MTYFIIKSSRTFIGKGYSGYTCFLAGIEPGKKYMSIKDAQTDAVKLTEINSVGFTVVDENGRQTPLNPFYVRWSCYSEN